jgi:hypothetical protein
VAVFVSYSHKDAEFADKLAADLVMLRHNVWVDRWELSVGDSLIDKIQSALVSAGGILIILSKNSVASEWCRKELNSGLIRELEQKQVIVLPCVIEDCDIPLFLRDKMYADFRSGYGQALRQIDGALLKVTNRQQGRIESPNFHTDWAYDWKQGKNSKLWYFDWHFVDHGAELPYCILTLCQIACNDKAGANFQSLNRLDRLKYIANTFSLVVKTVVEKRFKIVLSDAFEKSTEFPMVGRGNEHWLLEISSRRMGIDNGKDTLVHIDQTFERALGWMTEEAK